ncbi:MAG: hypothetical protein EHM42_00745 [Planctomycetaceae bacterium]|nr:MAG: hypothetical protein EHM42_00745 [Planctomycetaceae bacterium]
MAARYADHGVTLLYPSRWTLTEQAEPGQVTITISSPGTSFLTLCLFQDRPAPADVAEAALEAFRDEYTEIDIYPTSGRVCRRRAVAWDVEFFCLELTNSARIRAFRTPRFTGLLLFQGTDSEFETTGPIFEKITRSLRLTPAEEPPQE